MSHNRTRPATASRSSVATLASRFLAILLVIAATSLRAQDAEYVQAYSLIDEADLLMEKGKVDAAKTKYQEARTALLTVQKSHPKWNVSVVGYRLKYVSEKLTTLAQPAPAVTSTPPSAAQAPGTSASGQKATPPSNSPLKLLNAGSPPQQLLRIRPKTGDRQTISITMKIANDLGKGKVVKSPTVKTTFEATVGNIRSDGAIEFQLVDQGSGIVPEEGVEPKQIEQAKTFFDSFKGITFTGEMSAQGIVKALEIQGPASTNKQAKGYASYVTEALALLPLALPDEAVGPAAKWEYRSPAKVLRTAVDQQATFELLSAQGTQVEIKGVLSQKVEKTQTAKKAGAKPVHTKVNSTGSGELTMDLGKLFPAKAIVDTRAELTTVRVVNGKSTTSTLKVDTQMVFETH